MDDCDRFVGAGDAPKIRAVQRFSTLSKALKLDSIYGGRGKARLEDRKRRALGLERNRADRLATNCLISIRHIRRSREKTALNNFIEGVRKIARNQVLVRRFRAKPILLPQSSLP